MSDYRAVAAVTVTLQNMLQSAVGAAIPGATVKTGRPERTPPTTAPGEVNIFLYQVTPNAAFRNNELPVRRSDGSLIRPPQVALDLHYLISFYGDDVKQIPQLLMGVTVSTLHAHPYLVREDMPGRAGDSDSPLAGSGLEDQTNHLHLMPLMLSYEEMSKLWSILFQVPYALSLTYLCSAVLIEPDLTPQPSMPARGFALGVLPGAMPPQVEQVSPQVVSLAGEARIVLHGRSLRGDDVVRIGDREVAPESATVHTLVVALPPDLRPGAQTVRVARRAGGAVSNPVVFVLQPAVVGEVRLAAEEGSEPALLVPVVPAVGPGQRAALLLNEIGGPRSYSLKVRGEQGADGVLKVPVSEVEPGTYLVRVEVDGVASALVTDTDPQSPTFDRYIGPKAVIP